MTKPTPGPWEPLRGHRSLKIRGLRESKPPFRNIINFNGISRATSDEGQANAHLIAAAPEMYEVCEDAVKEPKDALAMMKREGFVFDNMEDKWQKLAFTLYTSLVSQATKAENAIAKAEGRG